MLGVDQIGSIVSTFDEDFDFGLNTELTYNTTLKETVHQLVHEVQVVFGNKGDNLTFRNTVGGKVISTADIEFKRN